MICFWFISSKNCRQGCSKITFRKSGSIQNGFDEAKESLPEVGPNEAVDDEVDGAVEHDEIPDNVVHDPSSGW